MKMLTGLVVEKKSISLPIVNGTLMETADDASRRPIASVSGFHSGLAKSTILRNDDPLGDSLVPLGAGMKRARRDVFLGGGVFAAGLCVELKRTATLLGV